MRPTHEPWNNRLAELRIIARDVLKGLVSDDERDRVDAAFDDLFASVDFTPTFVHNDLGPEHILIDDSRDCVAGIIDFEDAMIGDPLIDRFARSMLGVPLYDLEARVFAHYRWMGALHAVIYGVENNFDDLRDDGLAGMRKRLAALDD
jgi:aminoglycoside phosphotransferase (APT) family kinase protein